MPASTPAPAGNSPPAGSKLADLAAHAARNGEPRQISGRQEQYENLLNQYLLAR